MGDGGTIALPFHDMSGAVSVSLTGSMPINQGVMMGKVSDDAGVLIGAIGHTSTVDTIHGRRFKTAAVRECRGGRTRAVFDVFVQPESREGARS